MSTLLLNANPEPVFHTRGSVRPSANGPAFLARQFFVTHSVKFTFPPPIADASPPTRKAVFTSEIGRFHARRFEFDDRDRSRFTRPPCQTVGQINISGFKARALRFN